MYVCPYACIYACVLVCMYACMYVCLNRICILSVREKSFVLITEVGSAIRDAFQVDFKRWNEQYKKRHGEELESLLIQPVRFWG